MTPQEILLVSEANLKGKTMTTHWTKAAWGPPSFLPLQPE